ncbi:MAG: AAA family ATPase [Chloroflexota bacterium]
MTDATVQEKTAEETAAQADQESTRRAWWLATRRRRPEWQSLMATGVATFRGRPRAHYEAAQPGDPVLLYVSRPDHAIRAVGIVTRSTGSNEADEDAAAELEVQLAFEVTNALGWREIDASAELAGAEPVRQRSSGTLFGLTQDEYRTLQALIVTRNPELAASFSAVDSGAIATELDTSSGLEDGATSARPRLREETAPYSPAQSNAALPMVRSIAALQALTGLPQETLEEARDLLEDTGQIILSGPPGTGKTWLARGLSMLVACDPARVQVVQFHPSTAYEDFIEGLKPRLDASGNVTYAVMPGIFVRMCEEARRDPEQHYVLLIDEINRAPLSRVFGELLYALEYRGPQGAVELAVSAGMGGTSQPFYVPENLLIIGTMNSADRSIALVDYALRRRFRFVELEPDPAILDRWLAERENSPQARRVVHDLFKAVNRRLTETLDVDHRLGHSYFMIDPLNAATLDRLWRTAIRPLIAEYFISPAGEVEEFGVMFAEATGELGR